MYVCMYIGGNVTQQEIYVLLLKHGDLFHENFFFLDL